MFFCNSAKVLKINFKLGLQEKALLQGIQENVDGNKNLRYMYCVWKKLKYILPGFYSISTFICDSICGHLLFVQSWTFGTPTPENNSSTGWNRNIPFLNIRFFIKLKGCGKYKLYNWNLLPLMVHDLMQFESPSTSTYRASRSIPPLPPRKCGSTDLSQSKAGLPDLKHQIVELMVHDVLKHERPSHKLLGESREWWGQCTGLMYCTLLYNRINVLYATG